ncbi:hypothetical protein I5M27_05770 [Adhaeribacter sp. BT258]|uniref:Flippase GtrA (Transmembrane translocase of bactoprenol-linked glucose) n=1 Tax=Adhaeribacter terrigena TaxID=2793070 RepID=A0ABS1BZA5_9BACT|nr:hypothetical protein [Adhaeribacter terrigena]MBK0402484.1 hypothetical protein [Adhaeribacter terrigena]
MKHKVKEWLKRYLPAEILSIAATLLAASLTFKYTESGVKTALAATWAGNIFYFGYILVLDVWHTRKAARQNGMVYSSKTFIRNLRALFIEFGIAEVFDSFLIRPALMYYLPLLLGNLSWGILLAKLLADVSFYVPAIISYEFSKKKNLRNFY